MSCYCLEKQIPNKLNHLVVGRNIYRNFLSFRKGCWEYSEYKTTVTPKINILIINQLIIKMFIFGVTVVLYFVKILSGSRNIQKLRDKVSDNSYLTSDV